MGIAAFGFTARSFLHPSVGQRPGGGLFAMMGWWCRDGVSSEGRWRFPWPGSVTAAGRRWRGRRV